MDLTRQRFTRRWHRQERGMQARSQRKADEPQPTFLAKEQELRRVKFELFHPDDPGPRSQLRIKLAAPVLVTYGTVNSPGRSKRAYPGSRLLRGSIRAVPGSALLPSFRISIRSIRRCRDHRGRSRLHWTADYLRCEPGPRPGTWQNSRSGRLNGKLWPADESEVRAAAGRVNGSLVIAYCTDATRMGRALGAAGPAGAAARVAAPCLRRPLVRAILDDADDGPGFHECSPGGPRI